MDNAQESEAFDLNGLSVCLAIPCYTGMVPIELMSSTLQTVDLLQNMGVKVGFLFERENALIDSVRNRLTDRFIKETEYQKLFFIDSDIIYKPEDFVRILAFATKHRIVAATYQARQDPPRYFISTLSETPDKYGMYDVDGLGFGFICIDKDVFLKQTPTTETYKDKGQDITRYFSVGMRNGEYVGEDMYFIKRSVHEYGEVVKLDPSIKLKHVGTKEYTSDPQAALLEAFKLRKT